MIVLAKNAEAGFLEELHKPPHDLQAFLCFHLRFSSLKLPKEKLMEPFFRVLDEIPNSYTAQVYVCQDLDIFILMRGFMQRQFSVFITKLSQELGDMDLSDYVRTYNMSEHVKDLQDLCQDKLTIIELQEKVQAAEHDKLVSDKVTQDALSRVKADLIPTVWDRRAARKTPLIMVVDDDQLSRTLVGNVLDREFDMVYAHNGKEALKFYVEHAPDVLFLDIGLPDINGHVVLELLFQMDQTAYVIMFSGRKDKENIIKALESGAQGFVGKPFTRDKLFQYVDKSPFIHEKRVRMLNEQKTAVT